MGLWLKRVEMGGKEEGWRREKVPGEKRQRIVGKERKGRRVVFLPGTSVFRGIPTVGQAVFCFGKVTKT